jgi:hypothetical protein
MATLCVERATWGTFRCRLCADMICNARLDPDWSQVDRRTLSIADRAISALI